MPDGYSRSPRLLKGALIELSEPFLGPIPNVIVFQYNPESMKRELTPWNPPSETESKEADSTAQPFDPGEEFDLTLELDASDALETPESHPVAVLSGVADRIAAMEMLLYPPGDSLLGGVLGSLFGGEAVPRASVPVVLFAWGPGRIVPVRLIRFSVDETAFNPTLYPIHAKVSVGLKVLTDAAFTAPGKSPTAAESVAIAAYKWTRGQKEFLARTNLLNSAESVVATLPF